VSPVPTEAGVLPPGARVALLFNPASRQGRDREIIAFVARALGERFAVDVIAPASAAAVEAEARASAWSHDAVVVAGGDGTVNRVVNGLVGSAIPLGVIPMGTGNDFARACGISALPARAVRRILDGRAIPVDLVRVNERVYCTVGLIGVASESALTVARLTSPGSRARGLMRLCGEWSYRVVGFGHLLNPGGITERVAITGGSGEALWPSGDAHAVFIANTRILGGGLVLPIDADPSDGLIEIAVVPRMSRLRLLWAFACFAHGWRVPEGTLQSFRVARAAIVCERTVPFSADGDLICSAGRFEVSVLHRVLRLIT
jgi:diacylglycerol kinase (ATP)